MRSQGNFGTTASAHRRRSAVEQERDQVRQIGNIDRRSTRDAVDIGRRRIGWRRSAEKQVRHEIGEIRDICRRTGTGQSVDIAAGNAAFETIECQRRIGRIVNNISE